MQYMNTKKLLTKSKFLEHIQCSERLNKSLSQPGVIDEATRSILQNGNEVGLLARGLFQNGIEVGEIRTIADSKFFKTQLKPGSVYFEVTFATQSLLARIDVLTVLADNSLKISEVKSTTTFKESEHLPDVYFQKRVIEEVTGLKVQN